MSHHLAIQVEGVSKKYTKSLKRSMLYGLADIGRNALGLSTHSDKLRPNEFWALDAISFEVARGESMGLIGPNGSGKTTILKMLNGIFWPDKGRISIRGRVGALIAVGAGFHPLLTGRENIFVNGAILGMGKREIEKKFDSIVSFADIGDFLDAPVKHYSSGMFVRLGFAVAVHCDPEVLLVDEVLAVGDLNFQQKCFDKIGELIGRGVSIVLVSHDMITVQKVCTKALLLHKGSLVNYGKTDDVIGDYYDLNRSIAPILAENRSGKLISSYGITYKNIMFFNARGEQTRIFESGEDIIAQWSFDVKGRIERPTLHFSLAVDAYSYNGYSTYFDGVSIPYIDSDTIIRIKIRRQHLAPGNYTVSIGMWDEKNVGCYFWDYRTPGTIRITSGEPMMGRFLFDHDWEIVNK